MSLIFLRATIPSVKRAYEIYRIIRDAWANIMREKWLREIVIICIIIIIIWIISQLT